MRNMPDDLIRNINKGLAVRLALFDAMKGADMRQPRARPSQTI